MTLALFDVDGTLLLTPDLARARRRGRRASGLERRGVRLALDRAGASAEEAVEIGDTDVDEETARAAGVRCIRADRLGSFAELLELVA